MDFHLKQCKSNFGNFSILNVLKSGGQFTALLGISESILMYLTNMVSNIGDFSKESQASVRCRIALTLCKLHLNLSFEYLGLLFGLESNICESYFCHTVKLLSLICKNLVS